MNIITKKFDAEVKNKQKKSTKQLLNCFHCRVDIADKSKKVLLNGFIESVKSLEQFADAKEKDKEKEFRKTKKLIKMLSGQL